MPRSPRNRESHHRQHRGRLVRLALSLGIAAIPGLLGGCALARKDRSAESVVMGRQHMLRGIEALQKNDFDQAERKLRTAVETAPHDERAHFQYARVLWRASRRADAMAHMKEAVRLSGGSSDFIVELGRMYLAERHLDAAQSNAEQVIANDNRYAPAHALRGDVYASRGRLDQALESYHLALALQPRNPEVQLAVADIYRTWGEPRRSLSTLQTIDLNEISNDKLASVYHLQGVAHRELGRLDDAIAKLRQALDTAPPTATIWCDLAETQLRQSDQEGARQSFEMARALDEARGEVGPELASLEVRLLR